MRGENHKGSPKVWVEIENRSDPNDGFHVCHFFTLIAVRLSGFPGPTMKAGKLAGQSKGKP
jgi:hypothetical protein